jgi:hypothetical protein
MSATKTKKPKAATVLTDEAVVKVITRLREKDPEVTVSGALKAFRAAGRSCAAARFATLMKKNGNGRAS